MGAKDKQAVATSGPKVHVLPEQVAGLLRAKRQAMVAANAAFQEQVSVVLSMLGYAPDQKVRMDFDAGTVQAAEAPSD